MTTLKTWAAYKRARAEALAAYEKAREASQ